MLSLEEENLSLKYCKYRDILSWRTQICYFAVLLRKHLRSKLISCICDREADSRSGKKIFDDFSH